MIRTRKVLRQDLDSALARVRLLEATAARLRRDLTAAKAAEASLMRETAAMDEANTQLGRMLVTESAARKAAQAKVAALTSDARCSTVAECAARCSEAGHWRDHLRAEHAEEPIEVDG